MKSKYNENVVGAEDRTNAYHLSFMAENSQSPIGFNLSVIGFTP